MFSPGETAVHKFVLPFSVNEINHYFTDILVTYKQDRNVFLEKSISLNTLGSYSETENSNEESSKSILTLTFNQEESLLFQEGKPYEVQLNIITSSGSRITSKPMYGCNGIQHHKEVI